MFTPYESKTGTILRLALYAKAYLALIPLWRWAGGMPTTTPWWIQALAIAAVIAAVTIPVACFLLGTIEHRQRIRQIDRVYTQGLERGTDFGWEQSLQGRILGT